MKRRGSSEPPFRAPTKAWISCLCTAASRSNRLAWIPTRSSPRGSCLTRTTCITISGTRCPSGASHPRTEVAAQPCRQLGVLAREPRAKVASQRGVNWRVGVLCALSNIVDVHVGCPGSRPGGVQRPRPKSVHAPEVNLAEVRLGDAQKLAGSTQHPSRVVGEVLHQVHLNAVAAGSTSKIDELTVVVPSVEV